MFYPDLSNGYAVRSPKDEDAAGLLNLVGECYAEYDGVVFEPDGIDADLNAYASALKAAGGKGYVLVCEQTQDIVGLVSGCPTNDPAVHQLKRLYLNKNHRGKGGLAKRLLELIEADALAHQNSVIHLELWSDTRFERAHGFYEREGFQRSGKMRELHDLSASVEYHFVKKLR